MKNKIIYSFIFCAIFLTTFSVKAEIENNTPKLSFSIGSAYLTNEGFEKLEGSGRTVNDEDSATQFMVGYNISPNITLEAGALGSNEITSSMYVGSSGTLHGKSYSVSQGCARCLPTEGSGTINLKAQIDTSYLLGIKYNFNPKGALKVFTTLGVLYWDVDYTALNAQLVYDGSAKSGRFLEVEGNDAYMGLGARYEINNNSAIAFEYLVSKIHDSRIRASSIAFKQSF